jgi:hypothetical protein
MCLQLSLEGVKIAEGGLKVVSQLVANSSPPPPLIEDHPTSSESNGDDIPFNLLHSLRGKYHKGRDAIPRVFIKLEEGEMMRSVSAQSQSVAIAFRDLVISVANTLVNDQHFTLDGTATPYHLFIAMATPWASYRMDRS